MRRPSTADRSELLFQVYKSEKTGKPLRLGAKDGSIPTHPAVPCADIAEAEVLKACLRWLRRRGLVADRLNVGAGKLGGSGYHTYGIPGAGDILGLLPSGRHFEIECKRGRGGRLSKKQQERRRKILTSNGVYIIIHSVEELEHHAKLLEVTP